MNFSVMQKVLIAIAGLLPKGWATVFGLSLQVASILYGMAAYRNEWNWIPLEAVGIINLAGVTIAAGGGTRRDVMIADAAGVATNVVLPTNVMPPLVEPKPG